ncbi:VanZ family protein [Isachenkonia alkalipeptolytica]|uniref:VanZ-like domain-containing protein n=1 Tax=Isachenkonia alkalipeptolytica TaxID=2565777 RepID=A0AA44BDD8_9CLOT|nr:VanZ family protein [Isachenkonia alkalipeptolytica]NBG87808.1 hypothetical protein [Isachenkonia alkalipeptolytica]
MKKVAWLTVIGVLGFIYIASSIPDLRVLPVLRHILDFTRSFDVVFLRLSEFIAARLPVEGGSSYLAPIDTVMQDFLLYIRRNPAIIEFFLRKLAHIIVFFTLTLVLFFLLYQYISSKALSLFLSFTGGFVFALLDEIRQSFVPGRTGSLFDVMINMVGVSLGILVIIFALIITSGERYRYFRPEGIKKELE